MTAEDDVTSAGAPRSDHAQITSIDRARRQGAKRSLTEAERRLLLEEIAKISAELGDLQAWAADIARRVAARPTERTERSA